MEGKLNKVVNCKNVTKYKDINIMASAIIDKK